MKITIEVDTEVDGERAAVLMLQAQDIEASVTQLAEEMRQAYKHGDDEAARKWRERLYVILDLHNVRFE